MTTAFTLATAYVELKSKGKLAEDLGLQKQKIKDLGAALKSGDFAKHVKQSAELNKQMERLQKLAHFKELTATKGMLGGTFAYIGERVTGLKKSIQGLAGIAGRTFAAGTGLVTGTVAAASPQAFSTFTGSLKLLAASVGTILLPILAQASYWIQKIAFHIRNLDQDTKDSIGNWVKWGLIVAGSLMFLPKILGIIAGLFNLLS